MDAKINAMLEKLKADNHLVWQGTVKVAENWFSVKGIEDVMDLMPDSLQGSNQLKTTVNILESRYGEDKTSEPKPKINENK